MARITGILKDGMGQPIANCEIALKALRTSASVIVHTVASQTPGMAGLYDMVAEPGQYRVTLCVDGYPPEYVGDIQVYKDSPNGTLNYFLGLPQDDDLRPDAIKHFEAMVDKVASQVAEVEKSKLAAEGSARSAAASADRASQITGLSTVADAISMASVPLPDVWIPFNDSLQMITGYGEEVKVGGVTVAKMVSFSRATTATYIDKSGTLRTAAINEPRFEKEGILIEGTSTNLAIYSNDIINNWTSVGNYNAEKTADDYTKLIMPVPTLTESSGKYLGNMNDLLVIGEVYTLSFWAYSDHDINSGIIIGVEREPSGGITSLTTKPKRYAITFKATQIVGNIIIYRDKTLPTEISLYVKNFQLEKSTFASSYIPTNGVSTTRSADIVSIELSNNWPACYNMDRTIVAEVSEAKTNDPFPRFFGYGSNNDGVWFDGARFASNEATSTMMSANKSDVKSFKLWGEIHARDFITCFSDLSGIGYRASRVRNPTFTKKITLLNDRGEWFFGNIRNIRIWHSVLSEVQLKVLK